MEIETEGAVKPLDRYLTTVDVWAIAFGCMVGWGVFAMPGTTFLPVAGPAGTLISMLLGMAFMLVIGANFSYLMGRSSMTGGVYSYTKEAFGRDHAFLSSWFLCLSYLTIVFLNGTALFIIVRTLFADVAQSGFHYSVAGNTIYMGETLVSVLVLAAVGILFVLANRCFSACIPSWHWSCSPVLSSPAHSACRALSPAARCTPLERRG